MKRKRIISSIVLACMAFGLTACGSKGSEGSEGAGNETASTITVQVEKDWVPYYEAVKERVLEKYPKATINFIETGSFDHLDVIDATDATNKDVADVFALPADRLYTLANNNILAGIDAKKMAEEVGGFKDFDGGMGGNFKIDDEYLAFPYNIETLVAYVNKENAASAGIDLTKPVEFTSLEFGKMLVTAHDAWFGVAFTNAVDFELLNKSADGTLSTDATKAYSELTDDQKNLFDGLYTYWKSHYENKTDLWDKEAASGYLDAQFAAKDGAAIRIDGPWATTSLSDTVGADNLEVLPLSNVTINGNELSHWKGGWGLGINARVEEDEAQMELAEAFIKEIVNPEYAKDLFKATGKILENVEASAYDGIGGMDEKVIKATYTSYEASINRPLFLEYGKVWETWQNALLSWSSTNPTNGEEAYKQVQASFEAMMATYK